MKHLIAAVIAVLALGFAGTHPHGMGAAPVPHNAPTIGKAVG